jgi:hypothetical protein
VTNCGFALQPSFRCADILKGGRASHLFETEEFYGTRRRRPGSGPGCPLGEVARRLGHSVETLVSTYVGALQGDDVAPTR